MGDNQARSSSSLPQTRTFVSVNLEVVRGEEKLSKVVQPRVDVSAVVLVQFTNRPMADVSTPKSR